MRGLILQLAKLDSEAEAQVRIVDFFDSLLRSHATLENVLRATAGLTGCDVGITVSATGELIGFDGAGRPADLSPTELDPLPQRLVVSNGTEVARVWIRDDDPSPSRTKDLILERLVLTCEVLWESDRLGTGSMALEKLLDGSTPRRDRERLGRLLGQRLPALVRVVCLSPRNGWRATTAWYNATEMQASGVLGIRRNELPSARWDGCLWLILDESRAAALTGIEDARIGVGPVTRLADASSSASLARAALQFAARDPDCGLVSHYDELGPICLLGIPDNPLLAGDPFVQGVGAAMREDPHCEEVLTALAEHGSIRAAAKHLHLHHSSVASRLDKIEEYAGISLRSPKALFALPVALAYWRARGAAQAQPRIA